MILGKGVHLNTGRRNWKKKLDTPQQMELCKRLAWYWRLPEIREWLEKEHQITMTLGAIQRYGSSERWQPIISRFREEYLRNITEVPLANKRKRLDELQRHYESAIEDGHRREAVMIIREARDEMERHVADISVYLTNVTHNEFHNMSDEAIQREKAKTLDQLEKLKRLQHLTEGGEDAGGTGKEIEDAGESEGV